MLAMNTHTTRYQARQRWQETTTYRVLEAAAKWEAELEARDKARGL